MVVRRALTLAGCSSCRASALKLLTGPILATALPTTAANGNRVALQRISNTRISARNFSSSSQKNTQKSAPEKSATSVEDEIASDDVKGLSKEADDAEEVPWYLQVEPPRHVATMEPPPLPEVPEDAPQLLGRLLEYAAEEMGLHDLSLLDLRAMDPQPALGSNLFMLFGTARSERHLSVSAGRMVRWLRAKHRVYADADGLLGPNEKKTKLRRKAKRAKLLGTMGTDDADDGISTGWVCVHLGSIDRDASETPVVAEDGRVAGFGVQQSGFSVVFQVMTESRRAELGLEKLWKDALEASLSKSADGPRQNHQDPLESAFSDPGTRRPTLSQKGHSKPKGQASFYSTLRVAPTESEVTADGSVDPLMSSSLEALGRTLQSDPRQKYRMLDLLSSRLSQSSVNQARQYFKDSDGKQNSTPFLKLFERAIKHLPSQRTWKYRLALLESMIKSHSHGTAAPLGDVRDLVDEMQTMGLDISREQFLDLLSCIYGTAASSEEQGALALDVFRTMEQRGLAIFRNDIITAIIEAKARSAPRHELQGLVANLLDTRLKTGLPCPQEYLIKRLLTVFVRSGLWEETWDTWRMPSQYLQPRSPELYTHMYRLGASSSPEFAGQVIRRTFDHMADENPPVLPVGEVRQALRECVHRADPKAHAIVKELPENPSGQSARLAQRDFVKVLRSL